jgi:cellulose synthase/poly-beta-1,6-N-acetylglucosamine synthase-like glycosyltransferase
MLLNIIGLALAVGFLTICFWGLYNLPILIMGIKDFRRTRQKKLRKNLSAEVLPTVSIVLPVKNEESVIGTLLTALSNLSYPTDKREIIIVEDGSTDKTLDICVNFAKNNAGVKILHRSSSNGKPSALNYGITHAKGEIVAIFDADNIPDSNVLMAVSEYFEDPQVAADKAKLYLSILKKTC